MCRCSSFREWCSKVAGVKKEGCFAEAMSIAWTLWYSRNLQVWEGKGLERTRITEMGVNFVKGWRQANGMEEGAAGRGTRVGGKTAKWEKPVPWWKKVNVDATIFENKGAISAICRDERGKCASCFVQNMDGKWNPEVLEAMAVREVLVWIRDRRQTRVVIESDCLGVVTAINNMECFHSSLGVVIQDCQIIVKSLTYVVIKHVPRSANYVAHKMKRAAENMSGRYI